MRHFINVIISLILCWSAALSCGSAKLTVQTQEKASGTDSSVVDSSGLRKTVESIVRESMSEIMSAELSTTMEVLQEKFSAPDSAGRTHITERLTVIGKSHGKSQSVKDVMKDSAKTLFESKDSISTERIMSDTTETLTAESEKKPGTSAFVRMLSWCGVLAVIMAILFVLRKIRLI